MSDRYALILVTPPAEEPLSLKAAKAYLRVDEGDTTQDGVIGSLIREARGRCERVTGRAMMTQTRRLTLDYFPSPGCAGPVLDGSAILLPGGGVVAVQSVEYVDSAGADQTLDPADYHLDADSEPARLEPAYGGSWPAARWQSGAVKVTYTCGYATADAVPGEFKDRIRQAVAYCYENRTQRDEAFLDGLFLGLWSGAYQ